MPLTLDCMANVVAKWIGVVTGECGRRSDGSGRLEQGARQGWIVAGKVECVVHWLLPVSSIGLLI